MPSTKWNTRGTLESSRLPQAMRTGTSCRPLHGALSQGQARPLRPGIQLWRHPCGQSSMAVSKETREILLCAGHGGGHAHSGARTHLDSGKPPIQGARARRLVTAPRITYIMSNAYTDRNQRDMHETVPKCEPIAVNHSHLAVWRPRCRDRYWPVDIATALLGELHSATLPCAFSPV